MNNKNFRNKLAKLKPVATSVCSKALENLEITTLKGVETEARFGRFDRNRFIPGVNKRQYDDIVDYFTNLGWKRSTSTDKVTSRTINQKQNIRKIESGNSVSYQLKTKKKVIDVPSSNYRLAKSEEKTSKALQVVFDGANKTRDYVVVRNRVTFKNDNLQVDLTESGGKLQAELEFVGKQNVCRYIKVISDLIEDSRVKSMVFNEYRQLAGQRFIGPLPQTLTKENFRKKILTKSAYSVTEKADGERFLLFIDRMGRFSLISRGMNITLLKDIPEKPDFAGTIMDGELTSPSRFYTFDIAFINGRDVRMLKLPERLVSLYNVLMSLRVNTLRMKSFFVDDGKNIYEYPSKTKLNYKNIYEAAGAIWSKRSKYPYDLDGLIFTPSGDQYFSKNILKWKDENTIDFYYDKDKLFLAGFNAKGKYDYIPFSGIDGKGTFKTKTKSIKNDIFTDESAPENIRKGKLERPITGQPMVGEFKVENNKFILIRKRPDKEFPNGVEASNQAWEAITKPVTDAMIAVGPGALRDFHSEIKSKLIMKYAKGKSVLDIGSGKGEDVGKYIKSNSKPVVGFDIVQEEYNHPDYMKFFKMNSPVYRVKNYINKNQKFDVININFAIHYFLQNKKLFESLVMNIHENLKKGGVLMATVLDGKLVYQALKGKNMLNTDKVQFTKRYNNSLNFNSPKFKLLGQEVAVMVKGTKYFNKPISEFLFNFEKFLKIMEQLGFELIAKGNFKEFCAESEWCQKYMTEAEKDYSFKNIYFILKKK